MAKPDTTVTAAEKPEEPATKVKADKPPKSAKEKTKAAAPARKEKKAKKAAKPSVKSDNSRIKFESTLPRLEAVAYFEAIVSGLRKGAVKFKQGEDSISLAPSEHVEIEVKAQRKRNKEHVSFEIAWRTDEDTDLTISAS